MHFAIAFLPVAAAADLTLLYSAWRKTAANSKVNYVRKRRTRRPEEEFSALSMLVV